MTKRFSTHSFAQMFAQQRFKVGHLSFKSLELIQLPSFPLIIYFLHVIRV